MTLVLISRHKFAPPPRHIIIIDGGRLKSKAKNVFPTTRPCYLPNSFGLPNRHEDHRRFLSSIITELRFVPSEHVGLPVDSVYTNTCLVITTIVRNNMKLL
jgi:hypothetical protein